MGLGASGFSLDLPSPGLMSIPDASQAPHQHAAAPAGVASRLMLASRLLLSCAVIMTPAHACPCIVIVERLTHSAGD